MRRRNTYSSGTATYKLQAIDRTFVLLDLLMRSHSPLHLSEIAAQLSLHKSTALRFLRVLEGHHAVCRRVDGSYHLGLRLNDFGERALQQFDARDRALPCFRRHVAEIQETGHLCVLRKNAVVYLYKISPVRSVSMTSRIGQTNPIHCTSVGKVMLAYSDPEVRDDILADIKYVKLTPKTHCNRISLLRELAIIRERGYAIDDEEIELGVRCVGAPILNSDGFPVAAISVSGPTSRITQQKVPLVAKRLITCCADISKSMGYKPPNKSKQ